MLPARHQIFNHAETYLRAGGSCLAQETKKKEWQKETGEETGKDECEETQKKWCKWRCGKIYKKRLLEDKHEEVHLDKYFIPCFWDEVPCLWRRTLLTGCGLWRTYAGARTSLRVLQPMEGPLWRLLPTTISRLMRGYTGDLEIFFSVVNDLKISWFGSI